jgi:DHA1 family bicyclomycin/chloramphenicol resistance-like MFS transporter
LPYRANRPKDRLIIGHCILRIPPTSIAFTFLLGLLATLPAFGIDMALPSLKATSVSLGVSASQVGLTISVFMLGFGVASLICGPVSDRYGRKPIVVFGCVIFIIAGIGCALAQSLAALLMWRTVQGAGAASTVVAMAIIRDLFEGQAARVKISFVIVATNVAPMIAPSTGAALLTVGGWRLIYVVLVALGLILLSAMWLGFAESARIDAANRLTPSAIVRDYIRVLMHPACLGYILVSATAFGTVFSYATGSSLYLINIVGLRPDQYGLIFSATALAVIGGALLDGRLSAWGVAPGYPLTIGLALLVVSATLLLVMTLAGWMPLPLVISLFIVVAFAFGMIAPNATHGAMQPLPQIAGAVGAASGCILTVAGAISSALVAILFDGHSALSMTAVMALCALLAMVSYLLIARRAEHVVLRSRSG